MATYKIKFFPTYNAFSISPAPVHDNKPDSEHGRETFKWDFQDGDVLELDWDRSKGDVTEKKLIFARADEPKDNLRNFPFHVFIDNVWIDANEISKNIQTHKDEGIYLITTPDSIKIKIIKNREGARWGFNFFCRINDTDCMVDPEMRIGTNPR